MFLTAAHKFYFLHTKTSLVAHDDHEHDLSLLKEPRVLNYLLFPYWPGYPAAAACCVRGSYWKVLTLRSWTEDSVRGSYWKSLDWRTFSALWNFSWRYPKFSLLRVVDHDFSLVLACVIYLRDFSTQARFCTALLYTTVLCSAITQVTHASPHQSNLSELFS